MLLDVKPWDDETDMVKLEECVRAVQMPGLHWGACELYRHLLVHLPSRKYLLWSFEQLMHLVE